jgi:predicted dehydrogenase
MLSEAADLVAERQRSKKKPKTYGDYRKMLKDDKLDIVLIGTPDHWHALPMIAAVEADADVYVQKPISVDVAEGQAMVAAARKHKRVVQVGTQRRSTPHLVEARDTILKEGKLGKIGLVEVYCYYPMRSSDSPPKTDPPDFLDYEMWTGPAPLRDYDAPKQPLYGNERVPHRRWWRAFMEYGNGITGDMCIHMLDMVRWMLDLRWPRRISSCGGILVQKKARSNIADTQTATFDFGDLNVVWQHRTWGDPPDPKYPWAATFYGDKGTLKASVMGYDFKPTGGGKPVHRDVAYELDKYPEDKTEKDIEKHVAPANRAHMKDFLKAVATRGKPVADIEEGHISTASCILANLSMKLGRALTWDADKGRVVGDAEANKLLRRPYRKPWVHPAPA